MKNPLILKIEIPAAHRYYVYTLAHPDGTVFYIGKGTGRRIKFHEAEAQGDCQCPRCQVIRSIWEKGQSVVKAIVFETGVEDWAHQHEMQLIKQHGREKLCNRTNGGEGRSPSPFEKTYQRYHDQALYWLWKAQVDMTSLYEARIESAEKRLERLEEWRQGWLSEIQGWREACEREGMKYDPRMEEHISGPW